MNRAANEFEAKLSVLQGMAKSGDANASIDRLVEIAINFNKRIAQLESKLERLNGQAG